MKAFARHGKNLFRALHGMANKWIDWLYLAVKAAVMAAKKVPGREDKLLAALNSMAGDGIEISLEGRQRYF